MHLYRELSIKRNVTHHSVMPLRTLLILALARAVIAKSVPVSSYNYNMSSQRTITSQLFTY